MELLLGTRKGFFSLESKNGGGNWSVAKTAFLGDEANLVVEDPRSGDFFAALYHGHFGVKLHRSSDRGAAWTEVGVPVYPEKPEGVKEILEFSGKEYPWKLLKIWALEPGPESEPGALWCGTIPGGLFVSRDNGNSWQMCRPLWDLPERKTWFGGGEDFAGIHSIHVSPGDPGHLTLGVSCAGVWKTLDGGKSWKQSANGMRAAYMPPDQQMNPYVQDPHQLAVSPADPNIAWAQHHNGIFKSEDGGDSWKEIGNVPISNFGFAVVAHPTDPETAWFVPAIKDEHRIPVDGALCVLRTRDGGQSFDVLREGLPQEHAYDLVFRHALCVDSTGNWVAFGSTTGNLFVSSNGGDSWTVARQHLPPIYSVRIAK